MVGPTIYVKWGSTHYGTQRVFNNFPIQATSSLAKRGIKIIYPTFIASQIAVCYVFEGFFFFFHLKL